MPRQCNQTRDAIRGGDNRNFVFAAHVSYLLDAVELLPVPPGLRRGYCAEQEHHRGRIGANAVRSGVVTILTPLIHMYGFLPPQ